MQYKTIILELLNQFPTLHEQLKQNRQLLPTVNHLALELKSIHQHWIEQSSHLQPTSTPEQTTSETLEPAIQELQARLSLVTPQEEEAISSLDQLMAAIQQPRKNSA